MHMSNQSLLVILLVGIVAGWLAGKVVRGTGFGIVGDLLVGIVGAFIGNWLLPRIGCISGLEWSAQSSTRLSAPYCCFSLFGCSAEPAAPDEAAAGAGAGRA